MKNIKLKYCLIIGLVFVSNAKYIKLQPQHEIKSKTLFPVKYIT